MLSGVLVPLLTPFLGATVDENVYAYQVERLLAAGVGGLVTGGIIGEGPTLAPAENTRLVQVAVEAVAGRVPVIATTGSNSTAATITATQAARKAGASAALVVTPYYNRPGQAGLFAHFEAVAQATRMPLILHNAPGRTNITLAPPTLERLGAFPAIFALLDEGEETGRHTALAEACAERPWRIAPDCRSPFAPHLRPPRACLSAMANVAPRLCIALWRQRLAGHGARAMELAAPLDILQHALDLEAEPAGLKYAVSLLDPAFNPSPRLPLTAPAPAAAAAMRVAVAALACAPLQDLSLTPMSPTP
ncbi:dihydrodipicolinate synthase family protein [Ancylobacter amanitiformis]|uniref:4-hydroxy-tetrahydrodipicolinate synthase n=1 Tax=Ancylobacter amanitiformis TaxID=217069 RepID=A0ABU0LN27_9HYPH|nr:dihydrodipicolinate synthase family protein [Ancylobacter amanitiformis]MDQ0510013.1 4-hydroxy-tetrahydrodipicolinate synthase [Ancylobacter amanitiformis]